MDQWWATREKTMNTVTAKLIESAGAKFIGYVDINPADIYIPKVDKNGSNNETRYVVDIQNVNMIASSIKAGGQDLSLPLPVVQKLSQPLMVDGKIYTYRLIAGHHRVDATLQLGLETFKFSEYTFESDEARFRFQLAENNHAPAKGLSPDDICQTLSIAVDRGYIENTRESMETFLKSLTHVHHTTKNAGIAKAIRINGAYQDYIVYTADDVKSFLRSTGKYTSAGHKDEFLNKAGWTVKEGYEYEYVMNAIKKYNETGLESYFLCHTKAPTERNDLGDKRDSMKDEFSKLENALESVMEFHSENGRFPWNVEGFLPQDNRSGEKAVLKTA
tara:strand:- start:1071 stop:2066 length:996 start_codon:yes stop_codon:yes gene_type:complete